MTLGDWVWWLVLTRAVLASVFMVIGIQMVTYAREELAIRKSNGNNGMQSEILKGQIRFSWLRVIALFLLGASAWLGLPFVGRFEYAYKWPQVLASSFVLFLAVLEALGVYFKWRERGKLLWMARNYREKTQAEGGRPTP